MVAVVLIDCTLLSFSAPPRACTYLAIISSTFWANRLGASTAKAIIHRPTLLIIRNLLRFRKHPVRSRYCTLASLPERARVLYRKEIDVQFPACYRSFPRAISALA